MNMLRRGFLYAFLIYLSKCYISIRTNKDYYVPFENLEVNCTSTEKVRLNLFEIYIDSALAVGLRYNNGNCVHVFASHQEIVQCKGVCKCTRDGKSVSINYNANMNKSKLTFSCRDLDSKASDSTVISRAIPVTSLILYPEGRNNEITLTEGKTQTFTCTTDSSRPASWINWYFDNTNVTNLANIVTTSDVTDNTTFISSRTLVYTVTSTDHLSVIYCDAANIDGRPKIRSAKKTLFIEVPVTALTLTPDGISNAVTVVSGETQEFMCTTDSNRPAAWIHWYLGGRNVTNDAVLQPPQKDGTMFISSSKLIYMGNIQNNNTVVYCEAVQRMQKIKSANKTLHIGYPPDPVVEIKTVCDVASLVIMWRSESNGGNEQIFHVVWQNILSDVEPGFANVSDPGVGSIVHYSAKMLLPNSFYTISVESTNIYGTVRSNKQVYCNTSGTVVALQVKKSSLSFSAGFGSGAALIVSINIVAISAVFISKRRRRAYTDGSNVYEQTKNRSEDSNDYNELNENPKVRPNQTGSGDKTYEDVGVDAIRISNADTKRKKKDKTSKLQNLKEDVRN